MTGRELLQAVDTASMSTMGCCHLWSSNEDTKLNPEGLYKTRGYSPLTYEAA